MYETSAKSGSSQSEDMDLYDRSELPDQSASVDEFSKADEISGKPGSNPEKEGLMHSVLDGDKDAMDLANMVLEATNSSTSLFTPEAIMERFVQNYRQSKKLNNASMIRQLTGYDPNYIERNMNIPEFKRHLQERIENNVDQLQQQGVLDREGHMTEDAFDLASVALAMQEIDRLEASGLLGKRIHKQRSNVGTREETKPYRSEPYRSINVAQSIKTAVRRGHKKIVLEDLRAFDQQAHGAVNIIYAIDTSGSMKGEKIAQAKRAGVALAYSAIRSGDNVGVLAFGKRVEREIPPCRDFSVLLKAFTRLRAGSETDIAACIQRSVELFPKKGDHNHLLLVTDALPTVGTDPQKTVLDTVASVAAIGITVSVIGVGLDGEGEELARKIVDIGEGRLSLVATVEGLDTVVLEDYYALK